MPRLRLFGRRRLPAETRCQQPPAPHRPLARRAGIPRRRARWRTPTCRRACATTSSSSDGGRRARAAALSSAEADCAMLCAGRWAEEIHGERRGAQLCGGWLRRSVSHGRSATPSMRARSRHRAHSRRCLGTLASRPSFAELRFRWNVTSRRMVGRRASVAYIGGQLRGSSVEGQSGCGAEE